MSQDIPIAPMDDDSPITPVEDEKPFRLAGLPAEIRRNIYEEVFAGSKLYLNDLLWLDEATWDPLVPFPRNELPNLLLPSKWVREEALPGYSESLTAWVNDTRDENRVPAHYLEYTARDKVRHRPSETSNDLKQCCRRWLPRLKHIDLVPVVAIGQRQGNSPLFPRRWLIATI
jgi:hypothetical protein